MFAIRRSLALGVLGAVLTPVLVMGQTTTLAPGSAPPIQPPGTPPESESAWSWLRMPKVTMPKVSMPKIEMPKMPANPLGPVKASMRKVGDGTKKAWEGTKELLTFGGGESSPRVASNPKTPSMWGRMFGGSAEPEPPQTVADWMAQPRVE